MSTPDHQAGAVSDVELSLNLLNIHYRSFADVKPFADMFGHPHPCDTRGWSQILVSALTGIKGINRKKGADLDDGSDVKAASTWGAIDTPRFNGCIKAGTKAKLAGTLESLDEQPYLFFVLWDHEPQLKKERCRVWVVRTKEDSAFREMAARWYDLRESGDISSNNFQLHPPRGKNSNVFRNECGNLEYPLLFCAVREDTGFAQQHYDPSVLQTGACVKAS